MAARLSTVYDLTSLRLHRDGSRVLKTSRNLQPRNATVNVRDSRGNWIARDAGGSGTVGKYRKVKVRDEEEESRGEVFDFSGLEAESEQTRLEQTETRKGKRKGKGKEKAVDEVEADESTADDASVDARTIKRRKFAHDFSYLDVPEPTLSKSVPASGVTHVQTDDTVAQPAITSSFLPLPSSDLLKCIHHFASNYYSERGQLFNASREFRREQKAKRLKKLEKQNKNKIKKRSPEKDAERDINTSESEEELDSQSDDEGQGEITDDMNPKKTRPAKHGKRGKKKARRKKEGMRDMYKVMDGSALMAIGMLLQEHVVKLLEPQVPDGWAESMAQAREDESMDEIDHEQDEDNPDEEDDSEERGHETSQPSDSESEGPHDKAQE